MAIFACIILTLITFAIPIIYVLIVLEENLIDDIMFIIGLSIITIVMYLVCIYHLVLWVYPLIIE